MRGSLQRIWRVALVECQTALFSRRMLVSSLLFVAIAGLVMYWTISVFSAMEREVLSALALPPSDRPGAVTMTLWKSKPFMNVVAHISGGSLLFEDIKGRHPIVLAYAMFIFMIVPILTLVVTAPRVADDIRSGLARYWLVRVSRTEWSLGKYLGEAMMLVVAMLAGGLAAWVVAWYRLPGRDGLVLLPGVLDWTARAWMYAFSWAGLFAGVSHLTKTGAKATALSVLAMIGVTAWPTMLSNLAAVDGLLEWVVHFDVFSPAEVSRLVWRRSPEVLLQGVVHLAALGLFYLSLGAAVFRRRDV